jgi:hypothetical protein
MLVLLLRNVILMHDSSLVTHHSSFLHLLVLKSLFMSLLKISEKGDGQLHIWRSV